MLTVVISDTAPRLHGFLASCLTEIAPGVFVGSGFSPAIRERLRSVLARWHAARPQGSVVIVWRSPAAAAGLESVTLGNPRLRLVDLDGLPTTRRPPADGENSTIAP